VWRFRLEAVELCQLQVNFRPRVFDAGLVYLLRHCHRVSLFGNRSTSSSVCTARMPTRDDRVALVLPPSLRRARGFIDWRHVGARRGGVTPARTRQAWPAGGEGDDCSRAYIEREGREMMPAGGGAALQRRRVLHHAPLYSGGSGVPMQ
jgi:hypothetical protein